MNNDHTELTAVQAADGDALTQVKALNMPDSAALTKSASAALRMAETFVITSQDDFEMCADELRNVKKKIDTMEGKRTAITGPMNAALKAINDLFRGPMAVLKSAESKFKASMLAYSDEQERIAAEASRVAEQAAAAARRQIEEEARKVEQAAVAERHRLAQEEANRVAVAQAEQQKLDDAAAEAAATGNAAAAAEAQRLATEAQERNALAESQAQSVVAQINEAAANEVACLQMTAAVTSAPMVPISHAKATGISKTTTVDFEVTDLLALVKHVAETPALITLLLADSVKLRAYVRSLGMNTNLPGVNVFEKKTLSARAA